jgi:hypothetical protein
MPVNGLRARQPRLSVTSHAWSFWAALATWP